MQLSKLFNWDSKNVKLNVLVLFINVKLGISSSILYTYHVWNNDFMSHASSLSPMFRSYLFLSLSNSLSPYISLSLCQFLLPICIIISTLKCLHDVFCNFFEKHVAWKCVESIMQICHHHLIWEKNKWKHNEYYLETFILNEGRLFLNICRAINNVILTVLPTCSSNVY